MKILIKRRFKKIGVINQTTMLEETQEIFYFLKK